MVDVTGSCSIELLGVQHEELTNEDLMELEAQRRTERRDTRGRSN